MGEESCREVSFGESLERRFLGSKLDIQSWGENQGLQAGYRGEFDRESGEEKH